MLLPDQAYVINDTDRRRLPDLGPVAATYSSEGTNVQLKKEKRKLLGAN